MPRDYDLPANLDFFTAGDQMLSKQRRVEPESDERRLFPYYGKNKGEVPITPGQTFKQLGSSALKSFSPFRPIDTLSRNSRESGPVRAQGRLKQRGGLSNRFTPGFSRTEVSAGYNEVGRPAKRQRREGPGGVSGSIINLVEDDEIELQTSPTGTSVSAQRASQLSSTSSQPSIRAEKSRNSRHQVEEFRQVERTMGSHRLQSSPQRGSSKKFSSVADDDQEGPVMQSATKPRRALALNSSDKQIEAERSKSSVKPAVFQSVEIRNPAAPSREPRSPPLQRQFISTEGKRRTSDTRESPDELQGDVTVPRVPASLISVRKREVNSGSLSPHQAERDIRRRSSPSDIRPTDFASASRQGQGKPNRRIQKEEKGNTHKRLFEVNFFRFGPVERTSSTGQALEVAIDNVRGTIGLEDACLDTANNVNISLRKVLSVFRGKDESRKIQLRLSKAEGMDDKMDIELSSPKEKEDLCSVLANRDIKIQDKSSEWMDKLFAQSEKNATRQVHATKRPSTEALQDETPPEPKPEPVKRQKLSASLQDADGNVNREVGTILNRPPRRPANTSSDDHNLAEAPNPDTHSHPARNESDQGIPIPVKKYNPISSDMRQTRSKSRHNLTELISDDDAEQAPQPPSDDRLTKSFKSIVYPRVGKRKAEVDSHDFERLRDGEFLNDNIIGFYLRFLEHHLERTNQDVAKRIYFFNSYFFATLTNTPRGKRGINYEGVEKWTRTVDIFSYDYIVVPINESAHWYLAIICNLPSLRRTLEDSPEFEGFPDDEKEDASTEAKTVDREEIPETPEAVAEEDPVKKPETECEIESEADKARESFASMTLSDKTEIEVMDQQGDRPTEAVQEADDDWPEGEENPILSSPPKFSSSGGKSRPSEKDDAERAAQDQKEDQEEANSTQKAKKQKRKAKVPPQKYDTEQPVIITFDSLDLARSPTIKILREYLQEEGKSKRALQIDPKMIKGMTAREIPLQPNFSDCGLYLLAYLEKFVQDPDRFISRVLLREMRTDTDWPPLKSGLLRRRLRKFLLELQDEQEKIKRNEAGEENIMADRKPISYLLGPSEPSRSAKYEDERSQKQSKSNNVEEKSSNEELQAERNHSPGEAVPRDGSPSGESQTSDGASRQASVTQTEIASGQREEDTRSPATEAGRSLTQQRSPSSKEPAPDPDINDVTEIQPPKAAGPSSPRLTSSAQAEEKSLKSPIILDDEKPEDRFSRELCEFASGEPEPPKDTPGGVAVEIQVPGTPPYSSKPSVLIQDSPRRSPRQARQKNKENPDIEVIE